MTDTIGLLHPGSMGSAFGAQLRARGRTVLWCPDGRSDTTRRRAEHAGLEAETLPELVSRSDVLFSLCPPAAAEETVAQVAELGMAGAGTIYVEANAVSPSRVQRIADRLAPMPVIDAAVVGSPPVGGKSPTLYLSGPGEKADRIAELFAGTDVQRTRRLCSPTPGCRTPSCMPPLRRSPGGTATETSNWISPRHWKPCASRGAWTTRVEQGVLRRVRQERGDVVRTMSSILCAA
ncbi:NAD(P)-binding domain-containing protein [Streptomyces sp. NPDC002845]